MLSASRGLVSAIVMAAVSTSREIEKSSQPTTVSSKSKNRMTSVKTAVNDTSSLSHCIINGVSTIETRMLPTEEKVDARLGCQSEMKSSDNENGHLNSSPFTIRNFVFTVRGQDFSKCWPFRHKILERCLTNGMNLELPPFDPPPKGQVCLQKVAGQESGCVDGTCEQVGSKVTEFAQHDIMEESSKQELACSGRSTETEALAEASGKHVSAVQEMAGDVESLLQVKPSEKHMAEGLGKVQLSGAMGGLGAASERSCDSRDTKANDVEAGGETNHPLLSHAAKIDVTETLVEVGASGTVVSADLKASCSENEGRTALAKDVTTLSQDLADSEIGNMQVVEADSGFHFEHATNIEDQHHKINCRLSSERCRTHAQVQKLAYAHHLEPLEVSTCMNQCQDENQESVGVRLQISDVTTAQTVEHELMREQNRIESGKTGENLNVAGIDSDVLAPQVCPVCLNFTSTSNTALNAHIDHCLATVLPGEKPQARFQKNRIKARKMRSMADICATAPARTLEDLELSCQLWALNEETSAKNVSGSLGWSDGLVRRQPRTPLYRGPAGIWKGNGQFIGESDLQQTLPYPDQNHCELEYVWKKCLVTKAAARPAKLGISSSAKMTPFSNVDCELQKSYGDEEGTYLHGSSKFSHGTSCVHTATVGMVRQNNIMQNLENPRAVEVAQAGERFLVDSFVHGNLGKSHSSKIVNASVHSDADEVLFGKFTQRGSARGSSPLPSSSEQVNAHCDTEGPVASPGTAAPGQLESAAARGKISLDPVLSESFGGKGSIVTNKRRKRKNGVLNLSSLQDVPKMQEGASLQNQEPSDHSWSGTMGFHGIVPVDTSAEEANRLLCKHGYSIHFPEGQQGEVDINVPQGPAEGFPSRSGDINAKGSQNTKFSESEAATKGKEEMKSFLQDSKGVVAAPKKQKFAQTELNRNFKRTASNAVDDQGANEDRAERSIKTKKLAPRVRRFVNLAAVLEDKDSALMAHSVCGDVGSKRGVWMEGLQDTTSDQEAFLQAASVNGSSNHQAKILKRKQFVTMQGIALGKASDSNKHARLDLAKECPSSCNFDMDHATQQFPEGSLVVLSGALAEGRLRAVTDTDKRNAATLVKEIPQCASVEGTELKDMTDELRPIASGILSKNLNDNEDSVETLEQSRNLDVNTDKLDKLPQTQESDTSQATVGNSGAVNPPSTFEFSKKGMFTVCHGESAFLNSADILKDRSNSVSLHKQTMRSGPAPSVGCLSDTLLNKFLHSTSNSCIPITSISSLAPVTGRCCRGAYGEHKIQSSSISWEGISQDLSRFQSVDNIKTKHVSFNGTASLEGSSRAAASAIILNGCISPGVSSSPHADNPDLPSATNAHGLRKHDPHIVSWSRTADNPDISKVENPEKLHVSHVRAMTRNREVVANRNLQNTQEAMRTVSRDHLFIANRSAHNSSEISVTEGLQKVRNVMHSSVDANDLLKVSQNQRDCLGPEISASRMVPMMSSPATSGILCQEDCNLIHRNGTILDRSQKLALINQKLAFSSDSLVDVGQTVADATDTAGAKDALSHMFPIENSIAVSNQQRSINSSLQFSLNEAHNVHEQMSQIPLQEVANICNTKMGGGPQIPQSAKQMASGNSSTITADYINLMPASLNVPGGIFTLPSNSPMHGEFASTGMNVRRDNLTLPDFTSRLNTYGGLNYPEEPGVVHIFGNPVFKLMGKNVMVTNKDAKSLGMGNPVVDNGRRFHTAGSVCHLDCMGTARGLDLLQDAYSRFPQPLETSIFMSQDMISSHSGACRQRNPSVTRDNLEIHPRAAQNVVLPTYGSVEHSKYRNPAVPEPAVSMAVSGETSRSFGSGVGLQLERQAVLNPVNQTHAEVVVIDDSFASSGALMPSILCKSGHTVTQQNGMPWLANPFSVPLEKAQIQGQAPPVLCRQEHIASADFLADLHKLGLSGSTSFHASNQRSGTLSDIVQSSDMSKDRLWSTLPGPMQ